MTNQYVQITERLFHEHLANEDGTNAFITQMAFEKKFSQIIRTCIAQKGELFISDVDIYTEEFSPLAITTIERLAKKHGYAVRCTNEQHKLEYLDSDRGGHYSTDFYRYLSYGKIRVTLRQS